MNIMELLTPISEVRWLAATDTVRDAFDHMDTYDVRAVPVVDWRGRYAGTVTEADLRRHVASNSDPAALQTPLGSIERRSSYVAIGLDRDAGAVADDMANRCFVPVVDPAGKLVGIIERRRVLEPRGLPSAA
jgi:CBS domain-containing protein